MRRALCVVSLGVLLSRSANGAAAAPPSPVAAGPETSLVSFSAGALIVVKPQEFGESWSAFWILDEKAATGWATPKGVTTPQTIVIALPERTLLKTLEFDTASADGDDGRAAKAVRVEMSDTSAAAGFTKISDVTLADKKDKQRFRVSAEVPGRWVRLTVQSNHGSAEYLELMDFRAYGEQLTKTPFTDLSGTYETNFGDFHVKQEGTSVSGCYEHKNGLLDGGSEGRVLKFTWREDTDLGPGADKGPAIMVFSPDGKQMFGLWWRETQTDGPGEFWNGTKKSAAVGSCPHWSAGAAGRLKEDLAKSGRVRLYGINFDTDSDHLKDESKATLDRVIGVLKEKPDWTITIEGHTDATSTAQHNQELSEKRASSVKAYFVTAGVDAKRLKTIGLGATKPVASNDTGTGRAQNRRVELTRP